MTVDAPDRRRWAVLAVMCLGLLIVGIDGTIVNVALPSLVSELGASTTELQWIVDAYTIIFAGFLLIAGNTGDRLGRKRCFVLGLAIFTAGSVACSTAGSPSELILFRGIQGFGAAFIMPATLSIISNVFTDDAERARAISLWAGVSGLGVAIGPLTGGYLLEHFWWGSIFLVNVPIGLITIVAALALLAESRDPASPRLDVVGTLLSTTGLIAVLYGIIEGPVSGWTDPLIVAAFVAGALLLVGFVVWELRTDHPILDVSLFANPRFSAASVSIALVFFAMFGSLFFISQYLQFVLGYTALQSGIRLLPVAAALMLASPVGAWLVIRVGTKRVVSLGLLLAAAGLALFSRTTDTSGYPLVAAVMVIVGVGMGLAMAPATDSIMGSVPPEKAGVGSAMNDTTREVGGALGVAILGSITTAAYGSTIAADADYDALRAASPEAAEAVRDSVGGAATVAAQLPAEAARAVTAAANHAFVHAIDRTTLVAAAVAAVGAAVAYLLLPARAAAPAPADRLAEDAALRLGPAQRRTLAEATLGLLADAGMSSLTYNAVAARSGVGAATLQSHWSSRVDAVTDALREVSRAHPIPDTGDLRTDLRAYVHDLRDALTDPLAPRLYGALVGEATSDPTFAAALRERVIGPRRAELARRLEGGRDLLAVPVDTALDQLIGPIFHRALLVGEPVDDALLDAVVASVAPP